MIPSPLLRRVVVAAVAALAISWPGMVSARAQAQPREGFSRTSPSGSYLAARHADGQRDVAAAASYYRAALRGDPRNNELLGRTFLAVLANPTRSAPSFAPWPWGGSAPITVRFLAKIQ
jgi:hypothetical protein